MCYSIKSYLDRVTKRRSYELIIHIDLTIKKHNSINKLSDKKHLAVIEESAVKKTYDKRLKIQEELNEKLEISTMTEILKHKRRYKRKLINTKGKRKNHDTKGKQKSRICLSNTYTKPGRGRNKKMNIHYLQFIGDYTPKMIMVDESNIIMNVKYKLSRMANSNEDVLWQFPNRISGKNIRLLDDKFGDYDNMSELLIEFDQYRNDYYRYIRPLLRNAYEHLLKDTKPWGWSIKDFDYYNKDKSTIYSF